MEQKPPRRRHFSQQDAPHQGQRSMTKAQFPQYVVSHCSQVSTNPQSSSQKASLVTGITLLGTAVIAEQAVARATCLDGFLAKLF